MMWEWPLRDLRLRTDDKGCLDGGAMMGKLCKQ
jgi:hypothetical protein